MSENENESYEIECRLCNGKRTVPDYIPTEEIDPALFQRGIPPQILDALVKQGKIKQVEKTCPACGGTGKMTAHKSLDELAKVLYKRSGSNLIVNLTGTALLGLEKTECGACGKKKEVVYSVTIGTLLSSGNFEKEQFATFQVCDKCMQKYGIKKEMVSMKDEAAPSITIGNDSDVKKLADENRKMRGQRRL